jgi:hypothetical protein
MARRRWGFQNLLLPMIPWGLSIVIALFITQRPEWQFLGINTYMITLTLIAFFMGVTISKITEIVPGEFEKGYIPNKALLWYVTGMIYGVFFTFYDIFALEDTIHRWIWGRIADLVVIFIGVLTLMRAYSACKALKLDTRS